MDDELTIKCPVCGSFRRNQGCMMSTAMGFSIWYDEFNIKHVEDPNWVTTNWTCLDCGKMYQSVSRYGKVVSII